MDDFTFDEQAAANVVAGLNTLRSGKRDREDSPDVAGGFYPSKSQRVRELDEENAHDAAMVVQGESLEGRSEEVDMDEELLPYPFFAYRDYSTEPDPDPLSPVTPPGRVPNFTAKMHAILSRPDLAEIICWMPHGRSWRVLKHREFEARVIPIYFEHAKFSSFIRQANGWGFRRITQGRDRNSYYNPFFLRGLPHLCKNMKRPGVAQKLAADPDHEPDLYKISEMHPVPETYTDESVLLQCTLQGGPKARMPIYAGFHGDHPKFSDFQLTPSERKKAAAASLTTTAPVQLTPQDREVLFSFEKTIQAFENDVKVSGNTDSCLAPAPLQPSLTPTTVEAKASGISSLLPAFAFHNQPSWSFDLPANSVAAGPNKISTLAAANQLAFANPNYSNPSLGNPILSHPSYMQSAYVGHSFPPHNVAAALQATTAASQFAAGFAAATAMSQHQFRAMIESLSVGLGPNSYQGQSFQNPSFPTNFSFS